MDHGTFPQRLVERARRRGDEIALREKKYGIWQEVTWREYAAHVRAVALGLAHLGLRAGDTVAVISGNRPAWLYVELAAQSLGAIPLGVFVDALPDQVQRVLDTARLAWSSPRTRSRPTRCSASTTRLPRLEWIVVDDMRGLETYREPMLVSLERVETQGRAVDEGDQGRYESLLAQRRPDDVALLSYTSGTTGMAKAAMISHRNLLAMAAGVTDVDRSARVTRSSRSCPSPGSASSSSAWRSRSTWARP